MADIIQFPGMDAVEAPCDTEPTQDDDVPGPTVWACGHCQGYEQILYEDGWVQCGNEDCARFFENLRVTFGEPQ